MVNSFVREVEEIEELTGAGIILFNTFIYIYSRVRTKVYILEHMVCTSSALFSINSLHVMCTSRAHQVHNLYTLVQTPLYLYDCFIRVILRVMLRQMLSICLLQLRVLSIITPKSF